MLFSCALFCALVCGSSCAIFRLRIRNAFLVFNFRLQTGKVVVFFCCFSGAFPVLSGASLVLFRCFQAPAWCFSGPAWCFSGASLILFCFLPGAFQAPAWCFSGASLVLFWCHFVRRRAQSFLKRGHTSRLKAKDTSD